MDSSEGSEESRVGERSRTVLQSQQSLWELYGPWKLPTLRQRARPLFSHINWLADVGCPKEGG